MAEKPTAFVSLRAVARRVSRTVGWDVLEDSPPLECSTVTRPRAILFVQKPHFLRGLLALGADPYRSLGVAIFAGNGLLSPERWQVIAAYARSRRLPVLTLTDADLIGLLVRASVRSHALSAAPRIREIGVDESWLGLVDRTIQGSRATATSAERSLLATAPVRRCLDDCLQDGRLHMVERGETLLLDDLIRRATPKDARSVMDRLNREIEAWGARGTQARRRRRTQLRGGAP